MACKIFVLALALFGVAHCLKYVPRNDFEADVRYLKLQVDGEEYKLTLKQRVRDVYRENYPVWMVKSEGGSYAFEKVNSENRFINGIFYDDDEYMASLLATYNEEETQIYYDGVVGVGTNTHVVSAVPEEWWTTPVKDEEEVKESEDEDVSESEEVAEQKLRSSYVPGGKSGKLADPLSVMYPKIMAVVDYNLYKQLGEDVDEVVKYVATFFNAVDLRYTKLQASNVELLVTGIVIVADEQTDLVETARDYFSEQFAMETEYFNYDTTFVLTTANTEALRGETRLGSICDRAYSTAYVQDNARFAGLISATHELGHLLNLPHDGYDAAESCKVTSEENTTVMAASIGSVRSLEWSRCSENILAEFTKVKAAECLGDMHRYE